MNIIKYLIVVEYNKTGFLIGWENTLKAAEQLSNSIFQKVNEYAFEQFDKVGVISNVLEYFDSYKINGNELYLQNSVKTLSNGIFSIHVLEINEQMKFDLQQFKKERENTSTVFEYENYELQLDEIAQLFNNASFIAN